jgi:thiamine-phosphate diphosphorylase
LPRKLDLLFYVITEKRYARDRSLEELIEPCLRGGASVIQLRNKTATTRTLLSEALRLRALTQSHSALFIVNDRVDVALACSADGVHLGADDMDPGRARSLLGPDSIIGLTVRSPSEAGAAEGAGVDYVAAGSVFESKTKRAEIIGLDGLGAVCRATKLPVVAIGGIGLADLDEVMSRGASGVAVAKEVLDTKDIEQAARGLRSALEGLASLRASVSPKEGQGT